MTIQRDLNGEVVNWMVHVIQVSRAHTDRPQKVFIGITVLPKLEDLNTEKSQIACWSQKCTIYDL